MQPTKHLNVMVAHTIAKDRGHDHANRRPQEDQFTEPNLIEADPLIGWHDLAKPARSRQENQSWKRNNQKGQIDSLLLAQLTLLFVIVLLMVGGLQHAG